MTVMTVSAYAWFAQSKKYQLFKDFLSVSLMFSMAALTEKGSVAFPVTASDIDADELFPLMNTSPDNHSNVKIHI